MEIVSALDITLANKCGELIYNHEELNQSCGLVPKGDMDAAKNPGKFPFSVSIRVNKEHKCPGTILSSQMIIASAKCLDGFDTKDIDIMIGKHNLASKTEKCNQIARVSKLELHPEFNPETLENNLALVKLNRKVKFAHYSNGIGNNNKICMPKSCRLCKDLVLVSWARKGQMKSINYKIVDQSHCSIKRKDKQSLFCVELESGKPNNKYDLGAALAEVSGDKYYLVGLMNDFSSKNSFRKIINMKYYSKWINDTVKKLK